MSFRAKIITSWVVAAITGAVLMGCQGVASSGTGVSTSLAAANSAALAAGNCPDAPGPITGEIVFGANNNLLAISEQGGSVAQITALPDKMYAFEPAWSPDEQTLAYTLARPANDPNLNWLPVGIICAFDRATGKGRVLARSANPVEGLNEASWTPDGKALVVAVHQPKLDDKQQYVGDQASIARYDLAGGTLESLAQNSLSPTLSPDGQRLAFLQLNPQTFDLALMLADADANNAQPVPRPAQLSVISAVRWSPDGRQLVFAGSGSIAAAPKPAARSRLDWLLGVEVAQAHGVPSDLWLVEQIGQPPRQLPAKSLDDPRLAWSPDGTKLAYSNGYGGITLLNIAGGETQALTEKGNYGGIAWAAPK